MSRPVYIFAGGGTGGHLYPGLAVAEELVNTQPDALVVFACSDRPLDRTVLDPLPWPIVPQPVRPLPARLAEAPAFLSAWRRGRRLADEMLHDLRPAAVLGLGGFAAGPVVRRAATRRIRTGLLNPDAVPGAANRYLARRADAVFTQFGSTADAFRPAVRAKVRRVGCPVRRALAAASREHALDQLGLDPQRKTLLVSGGSSGAANVNHALARLLADGDLDPFADAWQVLHVTGPGKVGQPPSSPVPVRTLEYCPRMDLALAAADLALTRGGAVTVAELAATGTPAVIMPYPYHADDQQRLNAAALAASGAAVVCDDRKDAAQNAAALREVLLPLLRDASRLAEIGGAAGGGAATGAASAVAQWLAEGWG